VKKVAKVLLSVFVVALIFALAWFVSSWSATVRNTFRILTGAPSRFTRVWQTVCVEGVGSFRVPTEWSVTQQSDVIYITDRPKEYGDYTIYIVGLASVGRMTRPLHEHEHFEVLESSTLVRGINYANTSALQWFEHTKEGFTESLLVIRMMKISGVQASTIHLLVLNPEIVDTSTASQIARTFSARSAR